MCECQSRIMVHSDCVNNSARMIALTTRANQTRKQTRQCNWFAAAHPIPLLRLGDWAIMLLHRRAFLAAAGSSLALFGNGAPFAQGAGVRRRSVRGMSANDPDLAAMSRAVAAMKALPQSDSRNWIRFADIHRNFCPHGNWYFLPWHRAYIASFERICQELSGKRDFALPYWNWTADRQFPAAFSAGDRNSNPLNNPRSGSIRLTE